MIEKIRNKIYSTDPSLMGDRSYVRNEIVEYIKKEMNKKIKATMVFLVLKIAFLIIMLSTLFTEAYIEGIHAGAFTLMAVAGFTVAVRETSKRKRYGHEKNMIQININTSLIRIVAGLAVFDLCFLARTHELLRTGMESALLLFMPVIPMVFATGGYLFGASASQKRADIKKMHSMTEGDIENIYQMLIEEKSDEG